MCLKRTYAIITARGGSKRIPKKNIRKFCGKPIISYSIEAALKCGLFDTVMVSTDSDEIADISIKSGAEVPFLRSERTSGDMAGTEDVLIEVIGRYKDAGIEFEEFCCIYPAAPFIEARKLIESHALLLDEEVHSVVPMVAFSFPPQRGMVIGGNGLAKPVDIDGLNSRSQDLPTIYHDSGQFYWIKTKEFIRGREVLGNHTKPYIISEMEMQDIDNEDDWRLAEIKYLYNLMRTEPQKAMKLFAEMGDCHD